MEKVLIFRKGSYLIIFETRMNELMIFQAEKWAANAWKIQIHGFFHFQFINFLK